MPPRGRAIAALGLGAAVLAVLVLAGCGDDAAAELDVPTSPELDVVGIEMAFEPSEIAVEEGTIPVTLRNGGVVVHDLRIEDRWDFIVEAWPGESATGEVTLEPGTYTIFCSIPGHRAGGMEGTLEVRRRA